MYMCFEGGINRPDSKKYMEQVALNIFETDMHNVYIEKELDNENVIIIIFDFNSIPFLK